MSSPCRGDVLTISNLQKHTIHAHETPRTKVFRYFNQFEDPRVLYHRDPSPIPSPFPRPHHDPWDVAKAFFSGTYSSPILGQKRITPQEEIRPAKGLFQPTFQSEDSDILAHIPQTQSRFVDAVPQIPQKRAHEDTSSVYSWSVSVPPQETVVENIYERRARRKMVKDPVTGTINSNAKQKAKPVQRKVAKVSRPNTFLDLRPLDNFESKFVGKKRLSFDTNQGKVWSGDLEFPRLAELGNKKVVVQKEEITKRALESNAHVRSGKRQKEAAQDEGRQLEISTYFESASKEEYKSHHVDNEVDDYAVIEENNPISGVVGENDTGNGNTGQDASPLETLKPETQHVTAADDSISRVPYPGEIKTKDSSVQTENDSIEVEINQSHYPNSHPNHPSLSQPGNNLPTGKQQPSTTPVIQQSSFTYPLDHGDVTLDQYSTLNHFERTPPEPQRQDLESLIQACNKLLRAPKPIRLAVPLPVHPVELTEPPNSTSQGVVNAWTQSPCERTKEIWMYPVEDGSDRVRYVSGPPLKKRRVFKVFPEGYATSCPGSYHNVEQMLETGVCPLIEGLPYLAGHVIGGTPVWEENNDLVLPGERLPIYPHYVPASRNTALPIPHTPHPRYIMEPLAQGVQQNMSDLRAEVAAMEKAYLDGISSDFDFDNESVEFISNDDEAGEIEDDGVEGFAPEDHVGEQEVHSTLDDREWWRQRVRRF